MAKTEKAVLVKNREDAAAAFLTSKATYAGSGFSGRLINPGYSGKVTALELRELEGINVTPRSKEQGPQMVGNVVVADEGENSVVLSLIFDDGRSIALPSLTNHPLSTIDGVACNKMTGEAWAALVGKQINCIDRIADAERPNIRRITNAGVTTTTNNPMQKYTLATVTV